jgi:hypothetical protein
MVTTIRKITIEGESYLSLYSVAECFACEPSWVEDVYAHGLLGHGHRHEGEVVILSRLLDRVATIRRFNVYYGVHLTAISVLLEHEEE